MADNRRPRRASLIIGASVLATALVIATASVVLLIALGIGNSVSAERISEDTPPALASVETGEVEELVSVRVMLLPTSTREVPSSQLGPGVVTRAVAEGTVLTAGNVLMAVNELPVLVLEGGIPAYRSIGPGSRGEDVAQLQTFLRNSGSPLQVDGIFGDSTAFALGKLYRELGYPMISVDGAETTDWRASGLPLSNHVFVASSPVVAGSGCGRVGTAVASLQCVLQSQERTPFIADSSERDLAGLPVRLETASGEEIIAKVGDLAVVSPSVPEEAPSSPDAGTQPSGQSAPDEKHFAVAGLLPETSTELRDSASVVLNASAPDGLRVPATAIWETPDGENYLREATAEPDSPGTEHFVQVLLCAGGYCAVRGDGVSPGMRVELLD